MCVLQATAFDAMRQNWRLKLDYDKNALHRQEVAALIADRDTAINIFTIYSIDIRYRAGANAMRQALVRLQSSHMKGLVQQWRLSSLKDYGAVITLRTCLSHVGKKRRFFS